MIIAIALLAAAAAAASCPASEAQFRATDQALLDAYAPGDRSVWDRVLAPDSVYLDENGAVLPRAAFLKALVPLPHNISGHIAIADYRVRFDGDAALVIHRDDERETYHGISLRAGYLTSETWLCRDRHWQLALIHTWVEAKDPPAIAMPPADLRDYVGSYRAAPDLVATIRRAGKALELVRAGRPPLPLRAETADVLFVPGEPRIKRIFVRDAGGRVTAFIDRREGEDIVWKRVR